MIHATKTLGTSKKRSYTTTASAQSSSCPVFPANGAEPGSDWGASLGLGTAFLCISVTLPKSPWALARWTSKWLTLRSSMI